MVCQTREYVWRGKRTLRERNGAGFFAATTYSRLGQARLKDVLQKSQTTCVGHIQQLLARKWWCGITTWPWLDYSCHTSLFFPKQHFCLNKLSSYRVVREQTIPCLFVPSAFVSYLYTSCHFCLHSKRQFVQSTTLSKCPHYHSPAKAF